MKTKLLLLLGAAITACSLTSCDVYSYPTTGVYGSYHSGCHPRTGYYGGPLLSYSRINTRPVYSGYVNRDCFTPSYSTHSYNRGHSGVPFSPSRGSSSSSWSSSSHRSFSGPSFVSSPAHHSGFSGSASRSGGFSDRSARSSGFSGSHRSSGGGHHR